MTKQAEHLPAKEGLLANLTLAWLGVGLILLPTSRLILWPLDSSFGAKSLVGLYELVFAGMVLANRQVTFGIPGIPVVIRWLALLWLGWAVVSIGLMEHRAAGLLRQSEWIAHLLFLFALVSFLTRYRDWREGLVRFVLVSLLTTTALIAYIWFNHPQPYQLNWRGGVPGFTHIRHFGYFAGIGVAFASVPIWDRSKPEINPKTLLFFLVSCLAWAGLFWAGGRAPLVAILGAAAVVLLVERKIGLATRAAMWFLGAAVIGALASLPFSLPEQGMGLARILGLTGGYESLSQYSSGRLTAWLQFLEHLARVPFFGEGPDGYLFFAANTVWPVTVQPHNSVIQAGFEWGLPGAALFLVLLAWLVGRATRNTQAVSDALTGARKAAVFCVLVILTLSLLDGTLYHAWTLMLFTLSLSLALSPGPAIQAAPESPARGRRLMILASITALLVVFTANAIGLFMLLSPAAPGSPAGFQARLLTAFPAPLAHPWAPQMLDRWPDQWGMNAAEKCEWLTWVGRHARDTDAIYTEQRTDMLARSGCE